MLLSYCGLRAVPMFQWLSEPDYVLCSLFSPSLAVRFLLLFPNVLLTLIAVCLVCTSPKKFPNAQTVTVMFLFYYIVVLYCTFIDKNRKEFCM